jgi:hypothetical protein
MSAIGSYACTGADTDSMTDRFNTAIVSSGGAKGMEVFKPLAGRHESRVSSALTI